MMPYPGAALQDCCVRKTPRRSNPPASAVQAKQAPADLCLSGQLQECEGGLISTPRLAEHPQGLALQAQPRVGEPPVQGSGQQAGAGQRAGPALAAARLLGAVLHSCDSSGGMVGAVLWSRLSCSWRGGRRQGSN